MSVEVLGLIAFRAVAVAFAAFALVQAVCNVLESLSDFDAAHLGYFLRSRLLRPGITFSCRLHTLGGRSRPRRPWAARNLKTRTPAAARDPGGTSPLALVGRPGFLLKERPTTSAFAYSRLGATSRGLLLIVD